MTQNQINYAKLNEERRHNLATEGYTGLELQETARHNVASEGVNWYSTQEAARHNRESENLNWYVGQGQKSAYDAKAAYDYGMLQVNRDTLELKKSEFNQQVWKDIKDVERDIRQLDIAQMNADTAEQSMLNAAEDMLWRYNLSVDQYVRSGYYKDMAAAFRDLSQGGKNVNDIIDSMMASLRNFIISQSLAG